MKYRCVETLDENTGEPRWKLMRQASGQPDNAPWEDIGKYRFTSESRAKDVMNLLKNNKDISDTVVEQVESDH